MQVRWLLSQFFHDDELNMAVPVCSAYGVQYFCPTNPETPLGWALVEILCDPQQIEGAAQDTRVIVCPLLFDPSPLPDQVIAAYASWGAKPGMSLAALLALLAGIEPSFGHTMG